MASSYRDKAGRRAERMVAAIRDALRQGNGNEALTEACASLRSEMAKIRARRPADAALIDAQLAGIIAAWVDRAAHLQARLSTPARSPRSLPRLSGSP